MSRPTETCPGEIWHKIFALACTDTGLTGRSLSLVSKQFHDISEPLKYQSIAITGWKQFIAFSQIYPQLPDFQKGIKYLFIHFSYHLPDVKDDLLSLVADSDEEPEREEDRRNRIQVFFDKATHTILNEASSTLNILTLYWKSFKPLRIHTILSGVVFPFLDELHLFRCSTVATYSFANPSSAALLPRLRYLIVSGDGNSKCVDRDIAIIAPNLTHLRFTQFNGNSQEDNIADMSTKRASDQIHAMAMGTSFDGSAFSLPVMKDIGILPEDWQSLWSSRIAGLPNVWNVRRVWPEYVGPRTTRFRWTENKKAGSWWSTPTNAYRC